MELFIVEAISYDWNSHEEFQTTEYFAEYAAALETFERKRSTSCFVKVQLDKYTDKKLKDGQYRLECTMNRYGC